MANSGFIRTNRNLTSVSQYTYTLDDVIVDGKTGAVLESNGDLIFELLYEVLYWNPIIPGRVLIDDELRAAEVQRRYRLLSSEIADSFNRVPFNRLPSLPSDKEAYYMLHPTGWYPYGHLHDAIGRLFHYRDVTKNDALLLCSRTDRVTDFSDHAGAIGFKADNVVEVRKFDRFLKVPRLHYGVNPSVYTTFTEESYDWLLGCYRRYFKKVDTSQRIPGIYLSRNHVRNGQRGVINNEEVEEMLRDFGFTVLTGREPLETTYALFSTANRIIAPHGSSLVNTIFSPPDAQILEFCPDNREDHSFERKLKACLNYRHVLVPGDDAFNIEIPTGIIKDFLHA